jgi:hypothetical protein
MSKFESDDDLPETDGYKNKEEKKLSMDGKKDTLKKQLAPIKFIARVMTTLVVLLSL